MDPTPTHCETAASSEDRAWSVVILHAGKHAHWRVSQTLAHFTGRTGLAYSLFGFGPDVPAPLPAEILDGLTREQAVGIAAALGEGGDEAVAVPTAALPPVRVRAVELWLHRTVDDWHFSEVEGLIFGWAPLTARRALDDDRRRHPDAPDWARERFHNHQHPMRDVASTRVELREVQEYAEELAAALREAYPERRFVVTNWMGENLLSFYQRGNGAPETPGPWAREAEGRWPEVRCPVCAANRPYRLRDAPDSEFPDVEWGECRSCGGEVVVRGRERLLFVGD